MFLDGSRVPICDADRQCVKARRLLTSTVLDFMLERELLRYQARNPIMDSHIIFSDSQVDPCSVTVFPSECITYTGYLQGCDVNQVECKTVWAKLPSRTGKEDCITTLLDCQGNAIEDEYSCSNLSDPG